jgi:hypothetical protein
MKIMTSDRGDAAAARMPWLDGRQSRLKRLGGAIAVGVTAAVLAASCARAEELWDPYLRGVNEGLAAGAMPPPGVYGILDNYWTVYSYYNNHGDKVPNTSLNCLVEVPILLWVPGVHILGATYAAAIAQPFDYTSDPGLTGTTGAGNWGAYNTVLIPGQLAWTAGDVFVKTGFEIYLNDASSTPASLANGHLNNGGLPSGNGYTTVQPDLGISYLADNWDISADLHLIFPVTADKYDSITYRSGDEFAADYTFTKTIGKWTFGLGMHQEDQLSEDSRNGHALRDSEVSNLGAGPLIGYAFPGIIVLAEYNHNIHTQNDVAGDFFNFRFVVPF